jgi:ABC-type antimicrobial peptide transport system permease subunit
VVGVLGGGGIALLVKNVLEFPAQVTPGIALLGLLLSAVVGMAAGYWPARTASNLPVVDALRTD